MNVKISEMPSATSLDGTELVPIVQGGVSKKTTKQILTNNNYSTTEQVVGTWTDRKPLYQIVYTINSPTASNQYTDVDVTSLNIATLVKMEGLIDIGTDYRQLPIFDRVSNNFYFTDLWYSKDNKLLSVRNTNTSLENKSCNVIIQYTKTTD